MQNHLSYSVLQRDKKSKKKIIDNYSVNEQKTGKNIYKKKNNSTFTV